MLIKVLYSVEDSVASAEIERLVEAAGEKPRIINLQTADLGRAFLDSYLPSATVSDTAFPLNGAHIVEWFLDHDMHDYPLLGFSSTPFDQLSPVQKEFFASSAGRYVVKSAADPDAGNKVINQIVLSRLYNDLQYR